MGIRGLATYLRTKVPESRKRLVFGPAGQVWGVDCSSLLYRAKAANLSPITVFASLIVRMRRAGVEPIIVFDGKPPAAKGAVLEQRRAVRAVTTQKITELTAAAEKAAPIERAVLERQILDLQSKAPSVSHSERDDLKRFFYGAGVLFVSALGEADDLLGVLARDGIIQAVVSTDMDMLARGIQRLIVPETQDASVLTEILLEPILKRLGLTVDQFVAACVYMGSDYTPADYRTVPAPFAVEKARTVPLDPVGLGARTSLLGIGQTVDGLLPDQQKAKWAAGWPAAEVATIDAFRQAEGWPMDWIGPLMRAS